MANPNPIPHPFLLKPGTRQADRQLMALNPDHIKIDDRKLGELLVYLHDFASQINFYDLQLGLHDWQRFFATSLPFQLARLQHLALSEQSASITTAIELVRTEPQKEHLVPVFQEIYHDHFAFLHQLSLRLNAANHSFAPILDRLIASNLQEPLKQYIAHCNCLADQGLEVGVDLNPLLESEIWGLELIDLYSRPANCFDNGSDSVADILQMVSALEDIQSVSESVLGQTQNQLLAIDGYLQESLIPLQEAQRQKHDPQLGLLFSFLKLFAQFQGHLNQLSRAHLDYFFKTVLGIKTRSAKPDEAIVVFELQQHIDQYKLDKGRLVQDATDANDADIVFALDEEIVLDKAKAVAFRALHVNQIVSGEARLVEGVYVAPDITKADGKEEDFKGDGPHSWPTLGGKVSKFLPAFDPESEITVELQNYPRAQQGFVLASPILLLQEGERKVELALDLGIKSGDDDLLIALPTELTDESIFTIKLSSAEEWVVPPIDATAIQFVERNGHFFLDISFTLPETALPILPFLADSELFSIKSEHPILLIELNPEAGVDPSANELSYDCCLPNRLKLTNEKISVYQYLRPKKLEKANISVSVCEMKSTLVVQNDENLQDINTLIYPFGVRPSVENDINGVTRGSHFYVGSHEVFGKSWDSVQLNLNWKDKPDDFEDYYLGYEDITIGFAGVKNDGFQFEASLLEEGKWLKGPLNQNLFANIGGTDLHLQRPNQYQQRLRFENSSFSGSANENQAAVVNNPLSELTSGTRDGFLRVTLKNQDFQHRKYPFILARQMMAFGKFPEDFVFGAVYAYIDDNGNKVGTTSQADFNEKFKRVKFSLQEFFKQVERIFHFGDQIVPKALPIVSIFKKAIGENLLESLETSIGDNVVAYLEGGTYSDGTVIGTGLLKSKIEEATNALCGSVTNADPVADQPSILENLLFYIDSDISSDGFASLIDGKLGELYDAITVSASKTLDPQLRTDFANFIIGECESFVDASDLKVTITDAFTDVLDEATTRQSIIAVIRREVIYHFKLTEPDTRLDEALTHIDRDIKTILEQLLTNTSDPNKGNSRIETLIASIKTAIKGKFNDDFRNSISAKIETDIFNNVVLTATKGAKPSTTSIVNAIRQSVRNVLTSMVSGEIKTKILKTFREVFSLDSNFKFIVPAGGTNTIINDIKDAITKAFSSADLENGLLLPSQINLTSDFWTEGITSPNSVLTEYDMSSLHETKTNIKDDLQGIEDPVTAGVEKDKFDNAAEFLEKLKTVRIDPNNEEKLKVFAEYVEAQYPFDFDTNGDIIDSTNGSKIVDATISPLSYGDFEPNKTPNLVSMMPYLGLAEITEGLYFYTKFHRLQAIKIQSSTVVIPNEPYTPILKGISLDYTASADSQNADIDFYQLLPFSDSFQAQPLDATPELLYNIKDEGSLFIGVQKLTLGSILNLYFQMAEATADSEYDRAEIKWAYIKDNQWQDLRDQFQVLEDGTQGFTRSGIVKIAVPGDISAENVTLLPPTEEPLYWFKASAERNTAAICETIAVYTQAVKTTASLQPTNDANRLAEPLPKESLDKLAQADSAINTVLQPADSKGGAPPEEDDANNYYTRVSERLRHKGRGVNAFDYERIVLEAFPSIHTVKCITHSMSLPGSAYRQDLHLAPGFVSLALIPDLNVLKSANSATPKASISMLNEIKDYLQSRISPFVQLKVVNPRYEAVNVDVDVQFHAGLNASFYLKELAREIRLHLTPWLNGDQSKLCFAHGASQSDLVGFVESRPYIDFISCVTMTHEDDPADPKCADAYVDIEGQISPRSARSILLAGTINTRQFAETYCECYQPNNYSQPQ